MPTDVLRLISSKTKPKYYFIKLLYKGNIRNNYCIFINEKMRVEAFWIIELNFLNKKINMFYTLKIHYGPKREAKNLIVPTKRYLKAANITLSKIEICSLHQANIVMYDLICYFIQGRWKQGELTKQRYSLIFKIFAS